MSLAAAFHPIAAESIARHHRPAEQGVIMALDAGLRRQLVAARKNITAQLMQLEGAALDPFSFGGSPDNRDVYAELQKELHEIDDLIGADPSGHDGRSSGDRAYEPMATFVAPQAQWMWRFRGVAVGQIALFVIAWGTPFALRTNSAGSLMSAAFLVSVSLASALIAAKSRASELRLFLFTLGIGTAMVGAALLGVALTN